MGDEVAWTVEEDADDEWLSAALGPDVGASITHVEEHHSDEKLLEVISGRVLSITGAWCGFGPVKPGDRVHVPLAGSSRFVEMRTADTVDRKTFPDLHFNGWVVELGLTKA